MTSVLSTCDQRKEFYSSIRDYLLRELPNGLEDTMEAFSQEIEEKVQELRKVRTESNECVWKRSSYRGNKKVTEKAIMVPFINEIREPKTDPSVTKPKQSSILQCLPYQVLVKLNILRIGNLIIPIESLLQRAQDSKKKECISEARVPFQEKQVILKMRVKPRKVESVFLLENQTLMRQRSQLMKRANEVKRFNRQIRRGEIADLRRIQGLLREEVFRLENKQYEEYQNRNRPQGQREVGMVISLNKGYNIHQRVIYTYQGTTQNENEIHLPEQDQSSGDEDQHHFPSLVESTSENKIKIKLVDQENHIVVPSLTSSWRENFEKAKYQQILGQKEKQHLWETKSSARDKNGKGEDSDDESQFIPSDQEYPEESQNAQENVENTKILINLSNLDVKLK